MKNWGLEKQIVQDHLQSEYLNSGVLKASSHNYKNAYLSYKDLVKIR